MQLIIRSTNKQAESLVKLIKDFNLERSQIECLETIGHYNILVWIISENPIDLAISERYGSEPTWSFRSESLHSFGYVGFFLASQFGPFRMRDKNG